MSRAFVLSFLTLVLGRVEDRVSRAVKTSPLTFSLKKINILNLNMMI
jgi:hypothetical protein